MSHFCIKENRMNKKDNISVPEGYFGDLKTRLSSIPAGRTPAFGRVAPYLSLAASFLAILAIGALTVGKTADNSSLYDETDSFIVAELIPSTDPYALFRSESEDPATISEEDIVNYLIDSGMSIELIDYIQNERQNH